VVAVLSTSYRVTTRLTGIDIEVRRQHGGAIGTISHEKPKTAGVGVGNSGIHAAVVGVAADEMRKIFGGVLRQALRIDFEAGIQNYVVASCKRPAHQVCDDIFGVCLADFKLPGNDLALADCAERLSQRNAELVSTEPSA